MTIFAALAIPACASSTTSDDADDGEAETAAAQALGKADAATFVGLYQSRAHTHQNGDVIALQLLAGNGTGGTSPTAYVRERCYHAGCALPLAETDHYDTYASSGGKHYVRFWSFTVTQDANGTTTTPAIADVYEIVATSYGVKLRKSYTTRWVSLYRTTAEARCTATGGTFASGDCACGAMEVFVPGAGGCMASPGASESNCDDSAGSWTDDDATLTGSFCQCGIGRYDDASGSCATI